MEMTPIARALTVTYNPHPLLPVDRIVVPTQWREGNSVREYLTNAGIDPHREIVVRLNGTLLTVAEWDTSVPTVGDFVTVEGVVSGGGNDGGSNPVATVLSIALMVFAPVLAPELASGLGLTGFSAMGGAITGIGIAQGIIMIGGSLIISALFRPSNASTSSVTSSTTESPTYSLSGGSNSMRPYEPLPVVLGTHRIFPDYGAKPYTEYEGDDQYLYQVFNFGIGDLELSDLRIGETAISSYSDVTITRAVNGVLPGFYGNVDTTEGASLLASSGWIIRTTGTDTTRIALDISGTIYHLNDEGGVSTHSASFEVEYSVKGTGNWQPFIHNDKTPVTQYWSRGYWQNVEAYVDNNNAFQDGAIKWVQVAYDVNISADAHVEGSSGEGETIWRYIAVGTDEHPDATYISDVNTLTLTNGSTKPLRRTVARDVAAGQYDVRVRRTSADETDSKYNSSTDWTVLRSYQTGIADYSNQTVLGVKIKASGQLNGAIERLSALAVNRTPVWNGGTWVTQATKNPAWWYLHFLRGYFDADGHLLYGCGLSDSQIDIDSIKAFAVFCDANALTFSAVFDRSQTAADAMATIARCGLGTYTWALGKLGVVWDAPNQTPVMAFGMSNICKDSFSVSYVTEDLADEIVCTFTNEETWESDQVRVTVPGTVGTPIRPSTTELVGCTNAAMAAKFANCLAAQQVYRRRNITWETDFEGFVCQRGDVVILSHDLTQWGYSGRLVSVDGKTITLDRAVPRSGSSEYLMVQYPDGDTQTFTIAAGNDDSDTLTLPETLPLQEGYAAVDHKWYFSPLATPGKKVKIVSVQPVSESRVRLIATDEDPAYYAAWGGTFTAPAVQTLLTDAAAVSHLTLRLNQVIIDNFQVNRVTASWRQTGGTTHCTVRTWVDGAEFGTWQNVTGGALEIDLGARTGTLSVEVTPFGTTGSGTSVNASIVLSTLPAPSAPTLWAAPALFAIKVSWLFGGTRQDVRYTELWYSSTDSQATATRITCEPYPASQYLHTGLEPGEGGYYWARVIDTRGNASDWSLVAYAEVSTDPDDLLKQLEGALGMPQLAAELAEPIERLSDINLSDLNLAIDSLFQSVANNTAAVETMKAQSAVATETVNRDTAVKAETSAREILAAKVSNDIVSAIQTERTVTASAIAAEASARETLAARMPNDIAAAIQSERTVTATAIAAEASARETLQTKVGENTAAIASEASARSSVDNALVEAINTVQASLGNNIASVQQTATASANAITGLYAKWSVKTQVMQDGQYAVAGIELLSSAPGQSTFAILADKFLVYQPNGEGAPKQVMTMGTVNGVTALGFNGSAIFDGSLTAKSLAAKTISAGSGVIGDLAVETMHIAGFAVTTTSYLEQSSTNIYAAGNYDAQWSSVPMGFNLPVGAQSVVFIVNFVARNANAGTNAGFRIRRYDGTVVVQRNFTAPGYVTTAMSGAGFDSAPLTGFSTYTVELFDNWATGGPWYAEMLSVTALATLK